MIKFPRTSSVDAVHEAFNAAQDLCQTGTVYRYEEENKFIFSFYDSEEEVAFVLKYGKDFFITDEPWFTTTPGIYCPYIPLMLQDHLSPKPTTVPKFKTRYDI